MGNHDRRGLGLLRAAALTLATACASHIRPAPSPTVGALAGVTAFVDVAVIPMDRERVLPHQTVLVQDDRVVALCPAATTRVPSGAVHVDGRGKFLLPGLADMHAHLETVPDLNPSDRLLAKEQRLFLWLAHGLTTVRILDHVFGQFTNDARGEQLLQLRARAATGAILSPRLYTSGYIAGQLTRPDMRAPLHLAELAEAVRTYKAAGFDFIKVHPVTLRDSVFDSLAVVARQAGIPLVGHAVVPLEQALRTYTSIEHLSGYADGALGAPAVLPTPTSVAELDALASKIRELAVATRRAGVWNCPTLYNAFRNGEVEGGPLPLTLKRRLVKALQDAGAGLLAGSDRLQVPRWSGLDTTARAKLRRELTAQDRRLEAAHGDAGATHRELEAFVEAGLTPYQALATATRNPAAYFGTSDSTGTIAVGKRADLVLLAGNPLRDIRQTTRIAGVMRGGRWLDRAELDRRIAEISTAWLDRYCSSTASTVPSLFMLCNKERLWP